MKVFKFGGASIASAEAIRQVAEILSTQADARTLVVVSAMGKTTNALEVVADRYFQGARDQAVREFKDVYDRHLELARVLLDTDSGRVVSHLEEFRTEVEWLLYDRPVRSFDYYYDQIVCVGELMSTVIVAAYLQHRGLSVRWMDVRDIFRTNNCFREAEIDLSFTAQQVEKIVNPAFSDVQIVLTQGFIGATDENESTTLGREGSDYSAAIFAQLLGATSLTIWKDVPGVMTADPKSQAHAEIIPFLGYQEAVEMTFCGAQVIHPKTLRPLQARSIPLHVRSFIAPEAPGTVIGGLGASALPPMIIWKRDQALLALHTTDLSFLRGSLLTTLFDLIDRWRLQPTLIQVDVLGMRICIDDRAERIEGFCREAAESFDTELIRGLSLLTVRHAAGDVLERQLDGRTTLLRQEGPDKVQVVLHA